MSKVFNFCKNHFVETLGLLVILFLIFFISFLKYYNKTFECELNTQDGDVKVYQKYNIIQKNNKIKSIAYYYEVTSPNKEEMNQIVTFYKNLISSSEKELSDNHITLKYKKNRLIIYYKISKEEMKGNKMYKSTRSLVRNLKASKFTCK